MNPCEVTVHAQKKKKKKKKGRKRGRSKTPGNAQVKHSHNELCVVEICIQIVAKVT